MEHGFSVLTERGRRQAIAHRTGRQLDRVARRPDYAFLGIFKAHDHAASLQLRMSLEVRDSVDGARRDGCEVELPQPVLTGSLFELMRHQRHELLAALYPAAIS